MTFVSKNNHKPYDELPINDNISLLKMLNQSLTRQAIGITSTSK